MTNDDYAALQGRLFAYELFLTNLAFQWGITQPHPPTAVSEFLRPVEQYAAKMSTDPANDPRSMAQMGHTVQTMASILESAIHAETLRRTTSKSPGQA